MPVIKTPEGLFVDVPDDIDPRELKSLGLSMPQAAAPNGQAAQAPASTGNNQLMRQLGLTARMAVHGMTGTSGALADAAVGGINKLAGTQMPMPSVAQEQMLNRVLPQPQGGMENAVQAIGSPLAGAMFDPFMAGSARAGREMLPQGFTDAASKHLSPEMMQKLESLGSLFGGSAGGFLGHKLGGYTGLAAGAYAGQKFGKAGGEALARSLQDMMLSSSPFMGNSPNLARYATQIPLQWLTQRGDEQQ